MLDVATGALDAESERVISRSFETIPPATTILIVAHRLSTVNGCGRIVELSDLALDDIASELGPEAVAS